MATPKESATERRALRVLIVDDNKDAADVLAINLKTHLNTTTVANSGKAGLASARATVPDVVILDIGMVDPNGYEVARTLRDEFPGHPMLIIAVTGWAGEGNRQRAMDAGFDHHLVKPVLTAELHALIDKWAAETG